jgi:hypothetical protein
LIFFLWKSPLLAFTLIFILLLLFFLIRFCLYFLLLIFLHRFFCADNWNFLRLLFGLLNLSLWFSFALNHFCLFWFSMYFLCSSSSFRKLLFFVLSAILSYIWSNISFTCFDLFPRSLYSLHYCGIYFIFLHLFFSLTHFSRPLTFHNRFLAWLWFCLFFLHLGSSTLLIG